MILEHREEPGLLLGFVVYASTVASSMSASSLEADRPFRNFALGEAGVLVRLMIRLVSR